MAKRKPQEIHFAINDGECVVHLYEEIQENQRSTYHIVWSDGVANSWEEWYPTFATALARCATLAKCGETNFLQGFVSDPASFEINAERFFEQEVE